MATNKGIPRVIISGNPVDGYDIYRNQPGRVPRLISKEKFRDPETAVKWAKDAGMQVVAVTGG